MAALHCRCICKSPTVGPFCSNNALHMLVVHYCSCPSNWPPTSLRDVEFPTIEWSTFKNASGHGCLCWHQLDCQGWGETAVLPFQSADVRSILTEKQLARVPPLQQRARAVIRAADGFNTRCRFPALMDRSIHWSLPCRRLPCWRAGTGEGRLGASGGTAGAAHHRLSRAALPALPTG